jgi:hypothetical protein
MAAHHRWAAVVTATGALMIGLQGSAEADTISGTGFLPGTGIKMCGVPTQATNPTTTPFSPTKTPTTAPASTTTPPLTTSSPVPCIDASGNIFIFYIIAVTTTNTITTVSAPVLAANGSITWANGVPIGLAGGGTGAGVSTGTAGAPTGTPGASTGTAGASTGTGNGGTKPGGWVRCVATSNSTVTKAFVVSCPVAPPRTTTTGKPGNTRFKLQCAPAPPARVTNPRNSTQSRMPQRNPARVTHPRPSTRKRTPQRKPTRAPKRHPARYVVFCRST